ILAHADEEFEGNVSTPLMPGVNMPTIVAESLPPPTVAEGPGNDQRSSDESRFGGMPSTVPITPSSSEGIHVASRYKESRDSYRDLAHRKDMEKAMRLKKTERESKERILQQIREDREKIRERSKLSTPSSSPPHSAPAKQSTVPTKPPSTGDVTATTIQFRLPTGQTVKSCFPASGHVEILFTFVKKQMEKGGAGRVEVSLLQPFPRRVFGDADKSLTLAQAGLTPNASLTVLKSAPTAPAPSAPPSGVTPGAYPSQPPHVSPTPVSIPSAAPPSQPLPAKREAGIAAGSAEHEGAGHGSLSGAPRTTAVGATPPQRPQEPSAGRAVNVFDLRSRGPSANAGGAAADTGGASVGVGVGGDGGSSLGSGAAVGAGTQSGAHDVEMSEPDSTSEDESDHQDDDHMDESDEEEDESDEEGNGPWPIPLGPGAHIPGARGRGRGAPRNRTPAFAGHGYRLGSDAPSTPLASEDSSGGATTPVVPGNGGGTVATSEGRSPDGRPATRSERAALFSNMIASKMASSAAASKAAAAASAAAKPKKPVLSLKSICLRCVAALVSDPTLTVASRQLAALKAFGSDLAQSIAQELVKERRLERKTMGRLGVCPIETLILNSYSLATDSLLETIGMTFWPTLTKLSLRGCGYITDSGVWNLEGLKHLQFLDLSSCRITDQAVPVLATFKTLYHLNLSQTKISTAGIKELVIAAREESKSGDTSDSVLELQELHLAGCANLKGKDVFVALNDFEYLRVLNLSSTPIT
ncbi:hypothetical protein HK102_005483, partial [Quaeritorhiza haematococci]